MRLLVPDALQTKHIFLSKRTVGKNSQSSIINLNDKKKSTRKS